MLAEMESAAARLCMAKEPTEALVAAVAEQEQDTERWLLYRQLVRGRLFTLAKTVAPRTAFALGEDRWEDLLTRWLDEAPPTNRYFWRVGNDFAAWAGPVLAAWEGVPAWVPDLLRYEDTRWRVRYEDHGPPPEAVELSFERPPVLNPALELLELDYPVHGKRAKGQADFEAKRTHLVVVRRPDDDEVATWTLNPMAAQLVSTWREGGLSMTESVKRVTEARGTAIDQSFLEKLGEMLAGFLERGILLGSAP